MRDIINTRKKGSRYEQLAADYLVGNGYKIIARNVNTPFGEIDIIAMQEEVLVFIECKYRSSDRYGTPYDAVNSAKRQHIIKSAVYYYNYHGYDADVPCRFDVIAMYGNGSIEHIKNAFDSMGL